MSGPLTTGLSTVLRGLVLQRGACKPGDLAPKLTTSGAGDRSGPRREPLCCSFLSRWGCDATHRTRGHTGNVACTIIDGVAAAPRQVEHRAPSPGDTSDTVYLDTAAIQQ
eukprot:6301677-Prymnesium_polylepis.1